MIGKTSTVPKRRIAIAVAVAAVGLALFGVGVYVGNEMTWGIKSPREISGTAILQDEQGRLTLFDGEGGAQYRFHAGDIFWESPDGAGEGVPPCLKVGQAVPVDVGVLRFERPTDGDWSEVVWVRCP